MRVKVWGVQGVAQNGKKVLLLCGVTISAE